MRCGCNSYVIKLYFQFPCLNVFDLYSPANNKSQRLYVERIHLIDLIDASLAHLCLWKFSVMQGCHNGFTAVTSTFYATRPLAGVNGRKGSAESSHTWREQRADSSPVSATKPCLSVPAKSFTMEGSRFCCCWGRFWIYCREQPNEK